MINPYVLLAAVLVAIGAFFYGTHVGAAGEIAEQAKTQALVASISAEAQKGAAAAIAKNRPLHTTIQQKAEVITRENKIYTECVNGDDMQRLLDAARRNGQAGAEPAGDSGVSSGSGASVTPDTR